MSDQPEHVTPQGDDQASHGHGHGHEPGELSWFERPQNIKKIVIALVVVCVGVFVGGELVHKHGHFAVEEDFPGFYAVFGFVAYCVIIVGAVNLRKIVKRGEDYYDE